MQTALSDEELLKYNREGIIPGPDEAESQFIERARYCLNLKEILAQEQSNPLPFSTEFCKGENFLSEVHPLTKELFDITPTWLPLFFSNYKLTPWHGGCAWIFQMNKDSPTSAFLQLRSQFREKNKYLQIYSRGELIAHELSHVGRMMFEEPHYEEILAYRTCASPFRKWLGPIVQSSKESMLFLLLLSLILLLDGYLIMDGQYETYQLVSWLKIIPAVLFLMALVRLWYRQNTFQRCLSNLTHILNNKELANGVIYRLSDKEITLFSNSTKESIREYILDNSSQSLRWHLISKTYFDL